LFDDSHDTLMKGILGRLNKQADYGGSGSQPGSVADMSRLIVDYCIDSYEKQPKSHSQKSIAQTFSNYMNKIVSRASSTLTLDD
jgi:hypothetical protein